ncbi:MAG: anti-sigma factor antagonist [Deltaproteobacteria bacterium]|nr:MAG: anti-sigma factor antagonist [Deltaproteobacteria bacterium]
MSKLSIRWEQHGYVLTLFLSGSLDSDTSDQFDQYMTQLIEVGHRWLVVDLAELEYVSSAGVGVLVGSVNELQENNGDLRLSAVPSKISRVLEMLFLLDLFQIFPDQAHAVTSYNG